MSGPPHKKRSADVRLNTKPYFTIVLMALLMFAAFVLWAEAAHGLGLL
jgi:hypothetical protein